MFKRLLDLFLGKRKAFVIHETELGMNVGMSNVKSLDLDVDGFTDYSDLLFKVNKNKYNIYDCGIIYENGSKYKPQMLCNILKSYNPNIKLIVYKTEDELIEKTNILLT